MFVGFQGGVENGHEVGLRDASGCGGFSRHDGLRGEMVEDE